MLALHIHLEQVAADVVSVRVRYLLYARRACRGACLNISTVTHLLPSTKRVMDSGVRCLEFQREYRDLEDIAERVVALVACGVGRKYPTSANVVRCRDRVGLVHGAVVLIIIAECVHVRLYFVIVP